VRANFEHGDDAWWATLFATAAEKRHYRRDRPGWDWDRRLDWAVLACAAFRGTAQALALWLRTWSRESHPLQAPIVPGNTGLEPLHRLVATADSATYDAALAVARRRRTGPMAVLVAELFDTEIELVGPALDAIDHEAKTHGIDGILLGTAPLDVGQLRRLLRGELPAPTHGQVERLTRMALNWVHLHGDKALPFVLKLLDAQGTAQNRRNLLAIVRDFDSPAAYAALLDRIGDRDVGPIVQNAALETPEAVVAAARERLKKSGSKPIAAWLAQFAKTHAALVATR